MIVLPKNRCPNTDAPRSEERRVAHICIHNTRMKVSIRPLLGHLFLGNTINDAFHHYFPFLWQLLTGGRDPALGQFCLLLEAPVEPTLQRSEDIVVGLSTFCQVQRNISWPSSVLPQYPHHLKFSCSQEPCIIHRGI